jgi:pyrimidine-nucleoside phosphorylase
MQNIEQAKELANEMITIGKLAGRETICVLTNMDEPLGNAIGNSLEVVEAINALKGNMPEDLKAVVLELGTYMLRLANVEKDLEKGKKLLEEQIKSGKAYDKFLELIKNQGGDITYISDVENFEKAKYIEPIYSKEEGYIYEIDAKKAGKIACNLGAGRIKKEDKIDNTVGIVLNKKIGDFAKKDEVLAYIYANSVNELENAKIELSKIIKVRKEKVRTSNNYFRNYTIVI